MTRLPLALAIVALLAAAPSAAAQIPVGGMASDNVSYVKNLVRHTDSSGARLHDGYFYITTERDLSIYDVKDPENPELVGNTLLATPGEPTFTEEDPDTNGVILIVSNSDFHVYSVAEKDEPSLIGTLPGVDEHTFSCVLDCKYAYGSEGRIVDLTDPTAPKEAGNWRESASDQGFATSSTHDVTEVAPGLILTATEPMLLLDARTNPLAPKVLAQGKSPGFLHATAWPQGGTDRFVLGGGEEGGPACSENAGASFMTFDSSGWQSSASFNLVSEYKMTEGIFVDGASPATTWCVHWFDEQPSFANGGLVSIAWYEHGTRFLKVDNTGKIEEIGYYLPAAGQTSAVYWITDRVLYTADYTRGFDIIKFTGDLPPTYPSATTPPGQVPLPAPLPPAPAGPSFGDLVSLPSSKKCTTARKFRVRARGYRSDPVSSMTLRIGSKKVASAKGSKLKKGLRAKKLPRKRFTAIVEVTTRSGHKTAGRRTYRVCSSSKR